MGSFCLATQAARAKHPLWFSLTLASVAVSLLCVETFVKAVDSAFQVKSVRGPSGSARGRISYCKTSLKVPLVMEYQE